MPKTVLRSCNLCEAGCGLEMDVDGDRIVAVRPDEHDTVSHGYVCPKGMANAEIHLSPELQADGLFPAIDVARTRTHQAERLMPPDELQARTELRKSLLAEADPWAHLRDLLARDATNAQLLQVGDVPVAGKRRPAVATARARVQGA